MDNRQNVILIVGTLAGLLAFYTYTGADILAAAAVLFTSGWLLYRLSSPERLLTTLNWLLNPFMTALIGFMIGFSYLSYKGYSPVDSLVLSIGFLAVSGALGMFIWKYWNIGS